MGATHKTFDVTHGPTIPAADLARDIQARAARAVQIKPEFRRHVIRAVRQIDPKRFDEAVAAARQNPELAQQLMRDPASAYTHTLTHGDTQQAINRLRDLGAHGPVPNTEEMLARKDVLKPAWQAGAEAIKSSAEQHGGAPALEAEVAGRQHYSDMAKLLKGAEAANARVAGHRPNAGADVANAAGRAAAGVLVGNGPGGLAAAVAPAAVRFVAPRAAQALHQLGSVAPSVSPAAQKIAAGYGTLFQNHTPERRQQLDFQLQQMSPRYRAMRTEAAQEHANDLNKVKP